VTPPVVDKPRRTAYDVLRAVTENDSYAQLVLPSLLRDRRIDGRDAAFATELTYGTLRWRGTLDAVIARCVTRPLDELDSAVLDVLRLGAYQLLLTRIPVHAAVSTSVDLARIVTSTGPAKLVNAVLRKVAALELDEWLTELLPTESDPAQSLALAHAHPAWIVRALHEALATDGGAGWDETRDLLEADNERPLVTLAARPGRTDVDHLLGYLDTEPGRWSPYAVILEGGSPLSVPEVRHGDAGVQDEGSQLVAAALAQIAIEGPDERWLDLCAGPGGKAALLAGIAFERGATLTANEVAPHRARLVEQALAGSPGRHRVVIGDGTAAQEDAAWAPGGYDRVLVDAPCTGLGALRRRPEARWRRTPADLVSLGPLQRALLNRAVDATRPGGVIAYVTCSPHVRETRAVVADVMKSRGDLVELGARAAMVAVAPGLDTFLPTDRRDVQLWPHRHGTDAMYLALLQRQ